MPDLTGATNLNGLVAGSSVKVGCKITASTSSPTVVASALNPLGVGAIATLAYIHIKTGSSAACTLDVGVATTEVSSDLQMDGISVNAAANTVYDNIEDQGTHGTSRQYLAAGSWLTAAVASGDANGLVADFYWNVMPLTGGNVFKPGQGPGSAGTGISPSNEGEITR